MEFNSKVAVVTGAGSGIGKATAQMFAEHGAKVALIDIARKSGEAVTKSININGGDAIFIKADIANRVEVEKAAKIVLRKFERADILINNAGIEYNNIGNIVNMPYEKMKRIMDVNLLGAIHCVRSFTPIMIENHWGRIVNISSVQGIGAIFPGTSYQVTKTGVVGLTHSLAIELALHGINVNAVAPGAIATEGMGVVKPGSKIIEAFRQKIPIGRRGNPYEIAGPILFLCSEYSTYITGTVLLVDGGYIANITPEGVRPKVQKQKNDPDL